MTKIRRLCVSGFRGARFDLPVDFTKDHRSIAFYGENASGKSTLTDALEWFINNRVQHLWREGCKQDALRHILCDDDDPSQVEVHFSDNSLSGIKTLSPELEIEQSNNNTDFTDLINHLADDRIFLRHADITRFLDADKSKKREAIASFIGYEEITKFRGHIQSTGNALQRDATYTTAKSQIETHKTTIMELVSEAVTDMGGFYQKANELTKPFSISTIITDDNTYEQAVNELQESSTDPAKTSKAQQFNRFDKDCITLHTRLEAVRAAIHSTPAWEAEREAAVERSGAGTLRRRTDAAHDAERVAFGRFMEAPSQTPRGLYLKFEAGIDEGHWLDGAGLQFDENVMQRAIRRDLERLAGGMPS